MKPIHELLADIKTLCEKATPGPWHTEDDEIRHDYTPWDLDNDDSVNVCQVPRLSVELDHKKPDREFIAASRTLIPALLAVIEKAVEQRNKWAAWYIQTRNGRLDEFTEGRKDDTELARILNQAMGREE